MKTVSSTELRRDSSGVYNKVQEDKAVVIKHRDRPEMILMRKDEYEKQTKK